MCSARTARSKSSRAGEQGYGVAGQGGAGCWVGAGPQLLVWMEMKEV